MSSVVRTDRVNLDRLSTELAALGYPSGVRSEGSSPDDLAETTYVADDVPEVILDGAITAHIYIDRGYNEAGQRAKMSSALTENQQYLTLTAGTVDPVEIRLREITIADTATILVVLHNFDVPA